MSNVRVGTSGWNYPAGKGTSNGVFYPRGRRVSRSTSSPTTRAASWSRSIRPYEPARPDITRSRIGDAAARVLDQAVSEIRIADGRNGSRRRRRSMSGSAPRRSPVGVGASQPGRSRRFRRSMVRWRAQPARALAQFPPSFKSGQAEQIYLGNLLRHSATTPVAVNCGIEAGATVSATHWPC